MKKILFLLSFLVCALGMRAQVSPNDLVISGYVNTNTNNPTGVPSWPVYLSQDNGLSFADTYTDQNGFYSFIIPNGSEIGPNLEFIVYTLSCDLSIPYADTVFNNQGTLDSANVYFNINCGQNQNCSAPIYSFVNEGAQFQFSTIDAPGIIASYSWTIDAIDQNGNSIGAPQTSTQPTIWYNISPANPPAYLFTCLSLTYTDGCVANYCDAFYYCTSNFNTEVLPGNQILLTASSPNLTTSNFNWILNGTSVSGNGNTLLLQGQPNESYLVCLEFSSPFGCGSTSCDTVNTFGTSQDSCNAGFTYSLDPFIPGLGYAVQFNTAYNGLEPGIEHYWEFSNGFSSNATNLFTAIPNGGSITVCHTVFDNLNNCSNTFCETLYLPDTSINNCSFQINQFIEADGSLSYGAASADTMIQYSWTANAYGVNGNPLFIVSNAFAPGISLPPNSAYYFVEVCATISFSNGCQTQNCATFYYPGDTTLNNCDASFTYFTTANIVSLVPNALNQGPLNYQWYISNTLVDQIDPVVYLPVGTHDVCLYVWDGFGCQNYSCQTITIESDSGYIYCEAYYNYFFTNTPRTVEFQNWSFSGGDPNTVTYSWDFGDNTVSTEANPTHTYQTDGWYTVSLTINQGSCSHTYSNYIWISTTNPDCSASFYNYTLSNTAPFVLQFVSNQTGFSQDYNHYWTFSDGQISFDANPVMVFPTPGNYTACHYVQNSVPGIVCNDSLCMSFELWGVDSLGCSAFFTYSNEAAQPGYYTFAPYVADSSYTYEWLIGGQIFNEIFPSYLFSNQGYQDVCLTVYGANGCFDTYCTSVYNGGNGLGYTNIWGTVFAGANLADVGVAYLVAADSTSGTMQTLMETPITSGTYYFANVPEGIYYIRAELADGSVYYNNYVPTYFGSQYYWELAEPIYLNAAAVSPYGYTIALIYAGNNGGPGGIGGMVDEGPIRLMSPEASGLAEGPVSGANVLVTDLFGNPQRWTKSNANGGFAIGNLDYGTYRLMADVAGIPCVPVEFTIAPGFENFDIMLVLGDGVTSVANPIASEFITEVFPNPAKDLGSIRLNKLSSGEIQLDIINLAGQTIVSQKENVSAGLQTLQLPVSGLANGSYLVNITDAAGNRIGVKRFSIAH